MNNDCKLLYLFCYFEIKIKKNIICVLILIFLFFNFDGLVIIFLDLSGKYIRINIYILK